MRSEIVNYEADGRLMQSEMFLEAGVSGKRPAVLVFPEASGLGEHTRSKAARLAGLGYIALACDYYGNAANFSGMETIMGEIGPLMQDPLRTRARAQGGLDALLARPEVDASRIAAIGYCFGGTTALELARSGAAVVGVAGFHSGLATARPDDAVNIKSKVLVCLGADDPMIDEAARNTFITEMRNGGVDWQMHLYGGVVHSFTNENAAAAGMPEAIRYDAKADARSWATLVGFLHELFAAH